MSFDLTYNGIKLASVLTREFVQTPVRDSSGTDILYQNFRIGVEAVVNVDSLIAGLTNLGLVSNGAALGGGTTGQVLQSARAKLMEDRGDLVYYQNGAPVVSSSKGIDCNNGPHPISVHTTKLSEKTFKIVFVIECALVDCTQTPPEILNNRWSCADDVDEDWVSTRHWQGRLRLATTNVNPPHAYRGLVVPVLQTGWKRTGMNFLASPDGLELAYTITDRQIHGDSAPFPATKMSGTHSESIGISGKLGTANINVTLVGPPGADRRILLIRCAQILNAKAAITVTNGGRFTDISFTEHFGDGQNSVSGSLTAQRTNNSSTAGFLQTKVGGMSLSTIGAPMADLNLAAYVPGGSFLGGAYPATTTGLFACYLQSPCVNNHAMPQASNGVPDVSPYEAPTGNNHPYPPDDYTANKGDIPPDFAPPPDYSTDHSQSIYTHSEIESIYHLNEGRVFLPIAKAGGTFGDGGATQVPIRLNPRTAFRTIKCEMERIGDWPKIWKPEDFTDSTGIVHYLDKFTPNFRPPEITGDGRTLCAVDAVYVFALSRPPKDGEQYQVGSHPWDTTSTGTNYYSTANFIPGPDPKGL